MMARIWRPKVGADEAHIGVAASWADSVPPDLRRLRVLCMLHTCFLVVMKLHTEKLRMSESPLQHMQRLFRGMKGMDDPELRRQLGGWCR